MAARRYSERACARLRIAAALMGRRDAHDCGTDCACASVLERIDRMPPGARAHLKQLVDWVEAYEAHEATAARRR